MRKTTTKPRSTAVEETRQSLSELFSGEHIATPEADEELRQQQEQEKQKDGPTSADLQKQIADLTAQISNVTRLNASLMTRQVEASPSFAKEPTLDLRTGAPDPMYHQDEYNDFVSQRTAKYVKDLREFQDAKTAAETSAKTSQENKSEDLWNDFKAEYPEYSKNEDRVLFAAQKVADKARARGMNVETYMFTNRDMFMQDLTKEMDTVFGKPRSGEEEDGRQGEREEDEPAGRTGGLFGASGTPMPKTTQSQREAAGDMISEIREMQKKSGLY